MNARRTSRTRLAAVVVAVIVVLLVGVWLGGHPSWIPSGLRGTLAPQGGNALVNEVLDDVAKNYYRPINRNDLINKGLGAAIASLHDPYSHYFDPSDYSTFQNQSNPHLSGIGVDVLPDPKGLRIVDVFPGSPAARAGLGRGDLVVGVGSTSLANRSAEFAQGLIRGKAGTKVTLQILSGAKTRTVSITRANIVVPVASGNIVRSGGLKLGYLRFTSFTDGSGDELREQVQKVLHDGAQGLILDLRENGGGLLNEGVNVASIFISDGTIVSTDGRNQPRQVYVAKGDALTTKMPMVVLVDSGTASAAEIVTGALKDRGRATVVGTHTYGKGVFQEVQPLSNGGALDITIGEYFTPNGQNLGGGGVKQGAGIKPQVYALDNPHTKVDEALQVAERTVAARVAK
jgi:carboxyl-terminal processing protease